MGTGISGEPLSSTDESLVGESCDLSYEEVPCAKDKGKDKGKGKRVVESGAHIEVLNFHVDGDEQEVPEEVVVDSELGGFPRNEGESEVEGNKV